MTTESIKERRPRYRKIDPRIWNDAKFRHLSHDGQLVFFLLLTYPDLTSIGAMKGSVEGLAAENRWNPKAFREAFEEVTLQGMAQADEGEGIIYLPNFLRYNAPESPNCITAWAKAFEMLPECRAKLFILGRIRVYVENMETKGKEAFIQAFRQAFPEAFREGIPSSFRDPVSRDPRAVIREPRTVPENNTGASAPPRAPSRIFQKPSLEEVRAYIAEIKANVDAQAWFDHYESNGWKVGKNPMKCWKAAVRTWAKNEFRTAGGNVKKEKFHESTPEEYERAAADFNALRQGGAAHADVSS